MKLVDPMGEMLESKWEAHATALANAATEDALVHELSAIIGAEAIDLSVQDRVVVGRDTRYIVPPRVLRLKACRCWR